MYKMSKRWIGFTIVEILIAITAVAILSTIVAVGYNGVQRRAVVATLQNDLVKAREIVEIAVVQDRSTPSSVPDEFSPSADVMVTMGSQTLPVYSGLNPVQNGVLFHSICGDLVAEGFGRGINRGGQEEQYISACNVYNHPQLQVNSAWSGRNFNVPVNTATLPNVVASINYNDPWRPERDAVEKLFYQTWHNRFLATGGTYPVTSFWDPWASPGNGVPHVSLPEPTPASNYNYCIEARHVSYVDMPYQISGDNQSPTEGSCT